MITLGSILVILILFGLTIFVHELGHFLVARLCGMQVDTFSIGMGKAIWKKKVGGTTYQIGCLPLGGFVALPQMDPNSFLEGTPEDETKRETPLTPIPPWKKIAVSFAGAGGNILFAFLLSSLIWVVGKPMALSERDAMVGFVTTNSPALAAGLGPGDIIRELDDTPVSNWDDISMYAAFAPASTIRIRAEKPDGTFLDFPVSVEKAAMGVSYIPGIGSVSRCIVGFVYTNSPAEAAGLQIGDELLAFNGEAAFSTVHFSQMVNQHLEKPNTVTIRRRGETITVELTPRYDPVLQRGLIGISFNQFADYDTGLRSYPTPWAQIHAHFSSIFGFLQKLVTPKTAAQAASGVGGPVLIFEMFWTLLKLDAFMFLWFTAFLNINLAIINLLPLPILDGGHIVMNLWHILRGRPIPAKVTNVLAQFFAVLLILVFVLITYRDIQRSILPRIQRAFGFVHSEAEPVIFSAPTETPAESAP